MANAKVSPSGAVLHTTLLSAIDRWPLRGLGKGYEISFQKQTAVYNGYSDN